MVIDGNTISTEKHDTQTDTFVCLDCDYSTCHRGMWKRHLVTKKHNDNKMVIDGNILSTEKHEKHKLVCECSKKYNHMSGLSRHRRTCTYKPLTTESQNQLVIPPIESTINNDLSRENVELRKQLADQSNQIMELIKKFGEIIPRIGNNNNSHNTNIIFQLNSNYPNAIPIQELCGKIISLPKCVTHDPKLLTRTLADMLGHQTDEQKTIRAIKDTMYVKHLDAGFKADEDAEVFNIVKKETEKNQLCKAAEENSNMFLREKDSKEYPEMVLGITKDLTSTERKQMKKQIIKAIGST